MTTDNNKHVNKENEYLKNLSESKYQNKAPRMIRTTLEDGTVIIGKNRYDAIKRKPKSARLKKEQKELEDFEKYHGISEYKENIQKQKEAAEKRLQDQEEKKKAATANINKKTVWNIFKRYFEQHEGKKFMETKESLTNIKPIVLYFARDEEFLKLGAKDANGNFISTPSFDKGLCIVGGFGNGKTSIMNTMQRMFIGLDDYSFGRFSSKEIVIEYENAAKHQSPEILENFWSKLIKGELYIDDVKTEPMASAYGKKNLMDMLFQERYNKGLKTHISINYRAGFNGDVLQALDEFKDKYSRQTFDRIFEMYNVIEFTGKSFRR